MPDATAPLAQPGDAATEVVAEVTVAVPIERAFEAFTQEFGLWWPPGHHIGEPDLASVHIEPRAGGRWYEVGVDGSECDWGRVLAWDPPRHVAVSWHLDGEFRYVPDPDRSSRVDIRFAEVDGGTHVVLAHSGLDRHGAGWEQLATGVSGPGGWPDIIDLFARHTTQEDAP